jgi:hypothetical protein
MSRAALVGAKPGSRVACSVALGLALTVAARAECQVSDSASLPRSVTITPGLRYRAGWVHRVFFGDHYRRLWATPIEVPVLALDRFAGGLTPTRMGGGLQTKSLRFEGSDGLQYVFRSVDKDPSAALPPSLRESLVEKIVQDQISAAHPTGAVVVAPLLEAAGVLHAKPQLVVMPDDARLGEFRQDFAGMLGTIEERPTEGEDDEPGFAGADRVVGSLELFERLERGPNNRVDSRALLAARLLDVYLGDWDRHQDQWRWARFGEPPFLWRPIPRDRDQAFTKLDGFLLWLARFSQPQLVGFDVDYPSMRNLTWNARDLDRRLLVDLERTVWDSTAVALQARLTDSVIGEAVGRLPLAHRQANGELLAQALRERRDELRRVANEFYELLAGHVDVHATDEDELVEVTRVDDALVEVTISSAEGDGDAATPPYYRRRFDRAETEEVRLYLHGGDDRAVVRGNVGQSITVRIMGGGGDDVLIDSGRVRSGAKTRFYDHRGDNTFVRGRRTSVDRRDPRPHPSEEFAPPPPAGLKPPPPDWGHLWLPLPWTYYDPDLGFLLGGGAVYQQFGFRSDPYRYAVRVRAGYATTERTGRVELGLEVPDAIGRATGQLEARFSGIDVIRFHGLGNDSRIPRGEAFYRVEQKQFRVRPAVAVPLTPSMHLSLGTVFQVARTTLEDGTLLDSLRPYGVGTFKQLGADVELQLDTRNRTGAPSRGVLFAASGTAYPAILSGDSAFARVRGEFATYLSASIPTEPTLALRVGGEKIWGRFPFFEAAFLGGSGTVRGFRKQRFGGDASLFGNAELRLVLSRISVLLPGDIGVFGLADAGRVFLSGESSDTWHSAFGGGLWLSFLDRASTLSVAVARSDEETGVYVRGGFLF